MGSRRPAFLGIGAQRAATTWVHDRLQAHPDVFLPRKKEIHFFDECYERGAEWYGSHFAGARADQVIGEITPSYLHEEEVAERVARDLPEVRLFAILREPVSRARSSFELFRGQFGASSFGQACMPDSHLVRRGLYAERLERYFSLFGRERVLVLLYDDIRSRPGWSLDEICRHIGVEPMSPERASGGGTNSVVFPRAQRLLRRAGLGRVVELAKREPLGGLIRSGASRLRDRRREVEPGPSEEVRELFRADIRRLESLLERDLSGWL